MLVGLLASVEDPCFFSKSFLIKKGGRMLVGLLTQFVSVWFPLMKIIDLQGYSSKQIPLISLFNRILKVLLHLVLEQPQALAFSN